MSGSHYDYKYINISQLADELERDINLNNEKDEFGYAPNFGTLTIATLKKCLAIIRLASNIGREVEWLYSGDYGEETFLKEIKKHLDSTDN